MSRLPSSRTNVAFLEKVLSPVYVDTRPKGVVSDRGQFLASVKQEEAEPNVNDDRLKSTDVTVRLYGDTAVLTGRSGIVSDDSTGSLAGETRWTRIFLRQGGIWKLVAFQATLVEKSSWPTCPFAGARGPSGRCGSYRMRGHQAGRIVSSGRTPDPICVGGVGPARMQRRRDGLPPGASVS
jgi:hypothetical protein